ncbi:APC family permease [Amycolatopsis sp. NPDC005003]
MTERSLLTTDLAAEQQGRLHRTLGRVDLVFLLIAAVVSIEVLGQVSSFGGQTITWIVVLAITFLLPYAMVFAEIGALHTDEGGPYVWVKAAFGRIAAAVATILYWVTVPVWIGGSMAFLAFETWTRFVGHLPSGGVADYLFKLVFIWITISSAIISLRRGKWLPTVSAIAKVTMLVFFVGTTVIYAARHGVQGIGFGDLAPSTVGFLGLVPVLLYSFLGFEAGNGAGGEMRSAARDVPVSLARSAAVAAACYLLPIAAILVVLPSSAITGVSGLMDAIVTVYSVYGGAADVMITVTAVAFVLVLIGQGSAWMIVSDRTQATAAADGAFFGGFFGVFSRRLGTPLRINVLTGLVASLFLVAAMNMVAGTAGAVFKVTLSLCVSTYLMAYLLMIPAAAKLRRHRPADATSYRLPVSDRIFSLLAYVATGWVVLGSWVALFPGTLEGLLGIDYDFGEKWGVSRGAFESFTLGTLAVLLALGVLGYVRAARVRTASPPVASTPKDPDPAATG